MPRITVSMPPGEARAASNWWMISQSTSSQGRLWDRRAPGLSWTGVCALRCWSRAADAASSRASALSAVLDADVMVVADPSNEGPCRVGARTRSAPSRRVPAVAGIPMPAADQPDEIPPCGTDPALGRRTALKAVYQPSGSVAELTWDETELSPAARREGA
ncbi:hypothetical protein GCM10009594_04460 [Kocuria palustris]